MDEAKLLQWLAVVLASDYAECFSMFFNDEQRRVLQAAKDKLTPKVPEPVEPE